MNQMFKSATFKLTVWYLCLVEFISLIFSVVVYNIGTNQIDRGLEEQTERIFNSFPVFDNNPILRSRRYIDKGDHQLLVGLIFLNIVVLLLAGLVSYWLAKVTLKPIEEAHEEQKRFTANVSHELRTPLTAIKMESEVALLNSKSKSSDLKQTINSNLEEVKRLESIINNLLQLSTLEIDALRQKFSVIKSSDVAKKALSEISSKAKQRDITIKEQIDDSKIYGEPNSIIQMLVIVLDNAVKYSQAGNQVDFTIKANDEGKTVFTVSDHGIGIKKADLVHIFDRFYQADTSRSKSTNDGYGLGLSIAKSIADIHQAVISVRSLSGHGTTVDIVFPVPPKL